MEEIKSLNLYFISMDFKIFFLYKINIKIMADKIVHITSKSLYVFACMIKAINILYSLDLFIKKFFSK